MSPFGLSYTKLRMPPPGEALPGRDAPIPTAAHHRIYDLPLKAEAPAGCETAYFGMGCFWGAEKTFWRTPGVYSTAVGYQGGFTPNPTYDEVCSGRTGHAENVLIVHDPARVSTYDLLRIFWENHDPTQGYRQGNDVGTQYRSAVYCTTEAQRDLVERTAAAFGAQLRERGWGDVTTEIAPAAERPFYYAEDYHQQYLYKVPHGYDCHAETGLRLPPLEDL